MKRVKNISQKDAPVIQTRTGVDSATVNPADFKVVNGGQYHKREESHGLSPFRGRGLDVNDRPMKGDQRGSRPAAQPPRPQSAPNPAIDVPVLSPEEHVVGRAASQPAFKGRPAKQDTAEPLSIDGQADPNDFCCRSRCGCAWWQEVTLARQQPCITRGHRPYERWK